MGASASVPCVNGAELHTPRKYLLAEPHVEANRVRWKEIKGSRPNEVRGGSAAWADQRGASLFTRDWVAGVIALVTFGASAYHALVCLEGVSYCAAVNATAGLAVAVFPAVNAKVAYESSTAFLHKSK